MRDYHGEFEVHITVQTKSEDMLARFRDWCSVRGFKCVRIVLARGTHLEQPMATWRQRATTLPLVLDEMKSVAGDMGQAGFSVTRMKVEAAPDNDEVPLEDMDSSTHDPRNYFEHHVKLLRQATAPRDALMRTCETYGAHLSINAMREMSPGQEERFVTLRCSRVGRISSALKLQQLLSALRDLGETIIEHESEYCVYDSNLALDAGWLPLHTPIHSPL